MGLSDNRIPEEKLPQCWSDDVRMNALFAPFRLKSANPESWEMKMKFWSDMVRSWCRCKQDPIITAADAKFVFGRKGRTPACIEIVFEEMFRSGEISPITKYQQILHNGPEGWVRWGARLAFKPAVFALTAVTSFLPARQVLDSDGLPKASIDSTQRFVLESAVKEQATDLLDNFPSDAERLGTIEELMRVTNWQRGRETFEVLLGYLVSQGAAVKKGDVVKLAEPDKRASPVTESDLALVRLISAESRLESDATRLSRDIAQAESEARAALQIGNRLAAKKHLGHKHTLQARLTRCEAALQNVQQLLQQMRQVDVNRDIVDTYRVTSEAMKRGMKEGGLEEDAVHDTMDDLKEVMENYCEVEKALSMSTDDTDMAELEQELKELLSGPGAPGGGTPGKEERQAPKIRTPRAKKESERDFVFDGEERVIAELNELSVQDASPKQKEMVKPKAKKVVVAEGWTGPDDNSRPSKSWYPPSDKALHSEETWCNNNLEHVNQMNEGFGELRQDDRLHPGQPLNVDFTKPPTLYNEDFQVRDHKITAGVWLYNSTDDNKNVEGSTQYLSPDSPGKTGGFQMAPGGERKKPQPWPQEDSNLDDLERRLKNLRGFDL